MSEHVDMVVLGLGVAARSSPARWPRRGAYPTFHHGIEDALGDLRGRG